MYRTLQTTIEYLSGEWMLTKLGKANGGTIIFLRSTQTALIIFSLTLISINALDPSRGWEFSIAELQTQIISKFSWFGAIFAAGYVALYSRFASQWLYLANLYNLIKQSEITASDCRSNKTAEWKAGFMEDAEYLHMATKQNFALIIKVWGTEDEVKKKFITNTPGGKNRYDKLMGAVEKTNMLIKEEYSH